MPAGELALLFADYPQACAQELWKNASESFTGYFLSFSLFMCGGIQYQGNKIYFPQPGAKLPIKLRHGDVVWVLWGKRQNEGPGKFPNGGWARLDSIKAGKWKPWHPRPVLIPADSFMEKDNEKRSHWLALESGMMIQALLAERGGEKRVYVVTEETPLEYRWIHDRWPRLVRVAEIVPTSGNQESRAR
ncbi:MAG: hypothetical protein R6W74_09915 [Nitrosomonas halophila]